MDCLDIGTIQAFLDGEITQTETVRVSDHIGACDNCALMLADAEDENAVVFPALEREFNTLVPTQRLWSKINDSIHIEQERRPFWYKAWAFLAVSLTNPSMVAAASLLIIFGVVTTLWLNRAVTPTLTDRAAVIKPVVKSAATVAAVKPAVEVPQEPADESETTEETAVGQTQRTYKIERATYQPEQRRPVHTETKETTAPANESTAAFLPGEESYVKTIASLTTTVNSQKDSGLMRPAERIAYERDMAVVNDAITKMRTEVKRNPKDDSAKQVLYSSYQNKIDLLNSVSQKQELVASLSN